jgi:hypothetical protein
MSDDERRRVLEHHHRQREQQQVQPLDAPAVARVEVEQAPWVARDAAGEVQVELLVVAPRVVEVRPAPEPQRQGERHQGKEDRREPDAVQACHAASG